MRTDQTAGKILLVDDDQELAENIEAALASRGYEVTMAEDGDIALDLAEDGDFDLVITDVKMPVMGGMALLEEIHKLKPKLPVVIMTAYSSTDCAIEATKSGAYDYVIKPFDMPEFLDVVAKGVASSRLIGRPVKLGGLAPGVDAIVGNSAAMQRVYKEVGRIAAKPIPVLIRGETGTGKELIARAIYQHSNRDKKPFVAVNCAAIPDTLIESELFGHEKGAFTNAIATRIGRFEQADGGTLFLDEIGDLPWNTQVKLLRVLQEKTITRVGGKEDIPINVRIICATHRDLADMITQGKFREDLFYRINTVTVQLPALRERPEDIKDLVHYFLNKYATEFELEVPAVPKQAMKVLATHLWPGNVRQLENAMKKAMVDAMGLALSEVDVRKLLSTDAPKPSLSESDGKSRSGWNQHIAERLNAANEGESAKVLGVLTEDLERELYGQAVVLTLGNQSKIATLLGVSRLTVREKLDRYELYPKR
ncbi:MAG: response regulator [Verrucomicrobiaceae bacterium]|nr:response regulator [Verrucomicrobiaceae bacterium]